MVKTLITEHAEYEFSIKLLHGVVASLIALEGTMQKMDEEDIKAAISASRFVVSGASSSLTRFRDWEAGQ